MTEHFITLSTTEPNNNVGIVKLRHADVNSQAIVAQIVENGQPKNFEGLQPFFCLMAQEITGQGVSEESVVSFDAKNGTLKYIASDNALQMVGRNEAYFSFRKQEDGKWIEQFSTRTFNYIVEKSIYSQPFKDSNYWWTFKELYRIFNKYIEDGKNSWEEFVNQNKEILESVDPGGKILSELLAARNGKPNLKTRIDDLENKTTAQLAEKVDISATNKFKGYFGTNFDMQMSKDWDQTYPISKFVTEIQQLKPYQLDGVFITVEIQPLREQRLAFEANTLTTNDLQFTTLPDLTSLAQLVNLCETESIPIMGLKIHNNWSNTQWAKFDKTIWFSKYRATIDQIIAIAPTEKIGVLNESDTIWRDSASEANIIDLMNYLKGTGKKVTLEGSWSPLTLSKPLQNAMDYFAIHAYPSLSSKRERTTFSDCLMGWSVSNMIDNLRKIKFTYPDKEIWITETGVQNLWEALRAPEDYYTPEDNTPSADNLVQTLYFDSMFQYFGSDELVSGVFMWCFDSNYSLLFEKMLRKYREGTFHA